MSVNYLNHSNTFASDNTTTANIGNWITVETTRAFNEYIYAPSTLERSLKINEERRSDMKGLYDVYLCYGENRVKPIIEANLLIVADGEEDAKIKSGLMAKVDNTWDADYLTFIVRKIGDIKVKPKPSEVKNV